MHAEFRPDPNGTASRLLYRLGTGSNIGANLLEVDGCRAETSTCAGQFLWSKPATAFPSLLLLTFGSNAADVEPPE